ncbi:FAD-binding oxidoreductase [Alicyclobacillus mengziensis]|uniref:D-lactate dehydrogenase (cytochrome) n=1 Tax=Alicyclobacillus mengziensis TaxID=2931921 RepID=A0A9X7VYD2_9BACL|nr:FAD-linked oxidase C-terminal domain-containing protein [Alicyclobacillus mengziensis]QSO46767.1 FAD-binding protein [Alicyclobacillus mengziensis]
MTAEIQAWLPELLRALRPNQVTQSPSVLDTHSHDESYHTPHRPDAVVFPESTLDVVRIMEVSAKYGVPVVPFGVGSALEGHVVPVKGGITIDTMRMNKILDIRPDDFLVKVEPGVTRVQLNDALRKYGLFFPVDPGANASLGGMAATNASGTTTVRYGAMRDNVRSLTVVLADGSVIQTASLAAKSSSGYNLTGLFVGSEGTLGVFTEVWLKLVGIPEYTVAGRAIFGSVADAVKASTAMVGSGLSLSRVELVSDVYIETFNRIEGTDFAVKPTLFLEFGGTRGSVESSIAMASEIAEDEGCVGWTAVDDPADRARLWTVRHEAAHTFMKQFPGYGHMATDVCVPLSELPDAVHHAMELLREHGVHGGIIGHVGDGNFHLSLAVRRDNEDDMTRASAVNSELVKHAISVGGTCTGEHGVGLGKRKYQALEHGKALDVMRAIKAALDPDDRLNPGKLVDA